MTALVLLHGATEGPDRWAAVTAGLPATISVSAPALLLESPAEASLLSANVRSLTESLDAAQLPSAVVCGIGLGAMVALRLAVDVPARVDGLVLVTRQVRLNPMLMSLPAAVLRLMPAAAIQRLGIEGPQLVALLDQVRAVDSTPLARQTQAPALVLCGALNPLNRRASRHLVQALPHGRLQLLPHARADWPTTDPTLLTDALTTFVADLH